MTQLAKRAVLLLILGLSLLLTVALLFYPSTVEEKQAIYLRPLTTIPFLKNPKVNQEKLWQELDLSAQSAYAIDLKSATLLYEKNARAELYPASTAKMMTALVASDLYDLDQVLTVASGSAVLGSQADLQFGEQLPVRDLLAALLIFSANDAAYVLANHHPLGFTAFIEDMNQKAQVLHLEQSHFTNPAGLDDPEQLSSARDLTILAQELLKNDYLKNLVATPYVEIKSLNQNAAGQALWRHQLYSTNQLLGTLKGVKGVKTGTTELAGQVLVTLIEREGQEILLALMNSQDRYSDTQKLIAWIFNTYQFIQPVTFGSITSF